MATHRTDWIRAAEASCRLAGVLKAEKAAEKRVQGTTGRMHPGVSGRAVHETQTLKQRDSPRVWRLLSVNSVSESG